jgi:hypothetical protein
MSDNGVYNLGSTDLYCETFIYDGDEEGWVEQGTRSVVDSIYIRHQDNAGGNIDFEDCTDFRVNTVVIHDYSTTDGNEPQWYIGSRVANTESNGVRFGKVYIRSRGNGLFKFDNGVVNDVEFDEITFVHEHFVTTQEKTLFEHDGNSLKIGKLRGHILNTAGDTGNIFTWVLPTYTADSFIGDWKVTVSDLTTDEVRLIGMAQNKFAIQGIETEVGGGGGDTWRGLNIGHLQSGAGGGKAKIIWANSVPTAGTWQAGDMAFDTVPVVDGNNMTLIGWICTVAGTPGTWVAMYVSTVSPAT